MELVTLAQHMIQASAPGCGSGQQLDSHIQLLISRGGQQRLQNKLKIFNPVLGLQERYAIDYAEDNRARQLFDKPGKQAAVCANIVGFNAFFPLPKSQETNIELLYR